MKLLVIGQVWPEPTSSAAGWRMMQLLELFIRHGYRIHFASAASKTDYSFPLKSKNIIEHEINLNDSTFDSFVRELQPDVVMFDRFMIEEQYGWRVAENVPDAVRILDTEDLHFLRNARQEAFRMTSIWTEDLLYSEFAKREIASILRCDLSIMISKEECRILKEKFGISDRLIYLLPFLSSSEQDADVQVKQYQQRRHFVFIGNFLHEPNWQTVRLLKEVYWSQIRKKIPDVELHVYGAYPSQKILQLHRPGEGFLVKGRADNAVHTLSQYRVLIAPIPFGAGLKGKFVDSWQAGTPSVTTSIGAEGFAGSNWTGFIEDDAGLLVERAVALHESEEIWKQAQERIEGFLTINTASPMIANELIQNISYLHANLVKHRQQNFIGQILQSQQLSATKYMSRWIEEKNKGNKLTDY